MPGDVFVSYSRRDEEFVLRLVDDLEDRQALAWIDRGNIHGGEQWEASIENGIRDAKAFVLVIFAQLHRLAQRGRGTRHRLPAREADHPAIYRPAKMSADLNQRLRRYQILDFGRRWLHAEPARPVRRARQPRGGARGRSCGPGGAPARATRGEGRTPSGAPS